MYLNYGHCCNKLTINLKKYLDTRVVCCVVCTVECAESAFIHTRDFARIDLPIYIF